MRNTKPILLVEEDRMDAMMVEHALKDLNVTNQLIHLNNGKEALDYLRDNNKENPCVILLDLNMPETNGVEFIRAIKADKILKKTPIVVLAASTEEQDVIESFNLIIDGYVLKPVDYKKFVEVIRTVDLYWTLSQMPDNN